MKNLILAAAAGLALTGTAFAQGPGASPGAAGGNFSRADATAMVDRLFARVDLNKDGKITREEMQAVREQYAQSRPGAAPEGQPRGDRGGGMGMIPGLGPDGSITLERARAMALGHFDQMDGNGDGTVTQAEREAMRESRNRMMEQGMGGVRPKVKTKGGTR